MSSPMADNMHRNLNPFMSFDIVAELQNMSRVSYLVSRVTLT